MIYDLEALLKQKRSGPRAEDGLSMAEELKGALEPILDQAGELEDKFREYTDSLEDREVTADERDEMWVEAGNILDDMVNAIRGLK